MKERIKERMKVDKEKIKGKKMLETKKNEKKKDR